MTAETRIGKRTHEVRVGMSVHWINTWPGTHVNGETGYEWSGLNGRIGGWTKGKRSDALADAREAILAREALHRVVVRQDGSTSPSESEGT